MEHDDYDDADTQISKPHLGYFRLPSAFFFSGLISYPYPCPVFRSECFEAWRYTKAVGRDSDNAMHKIDASEEVKKNNEGSAPCSSLTRTPSVSVSSPLPPFPSCPCGLAIIAKLEEPCTCKDPGNPRPSPFCPSIVFVFIAPRIGARRRGVGEERG
ncbi:hypothetical protein F4803DRAFT_327320 [Xylaria telfairii]|nr:hypothetical protein F4803DRAFT_327320 [Xylaria telfairii]